jgi:hypothetical protein
MLCTVTAFRHEPATGKLSDVGSVSTVPAGTDMQGVSTAEVKGHPSGKFVFGSNRGHESIAVFTQGQVIVSRTLGFPNYPDVTTPFSTVTNGQTVFGPYASGATIVPIHVRYASCRELKTWDRFAIPAPGSRVRVIFDEALAVPAGLSEDDFETWRRRLEEIMLRGATEPF